MNLSNKRQAFVNEYLVDLNATQAAIRAGYSEKTAKSQGQRLLTFVDVAETVRARLDEKTMKADEVLERLTDIARGDLADLMAISTSGFTLELMTKNDNGEMIINPKTKLIKKIKQKVTTFLAKKESDEDREIIETEIELYSAHEALRDLGKYHGLFIDRQEVTGKDGKDLEFRFVWVDSNGNSTETSAFAPAADDDNLSG